MFFPLAGLVSPSFMEPMDFQSAGSVRSFSKRKYFSSKDTPIPTYFCTYCKSSSVSIKYGESSVPSPLNVGMVNVTDTMSESTEAV